MVILKVKAEREGPVRGRHPWVFSQAIASVPEGLQSGEPVRLLDEKGRYLATGYFNSYSQIAVRLWGYDEKEEIDRDFFNKRIEESYSLRRGCIENEGTDSYRLIHSENDLLPGLIVDKYSDYLVLQCHTKGISRWKELIVESLIETLKPSGIYERSDISRSETEIPSGLLYGYVPDLIDIKENSLRFLVDVKKGQKTGFFLDQRDKRNAVRKYSRDKTVLNAFSYTGAFSVYALSGGAKRTACVDTSRDALQIARENIKLNGYSEEKCEFVCGDAKKHLKGLAPGDFDMIILDPPAFIKDRKKKNEGLVGYKSINDSAIRAILPSGVLVTSSCSAHLSLQDFRFLISEAGGKTGKTLRILETFTHGVDHPELAPFTEGQYLKCFFISVG